MVPVTVLYTNRGFVTFSGVFRSGTLPWNGLSTNQNSFVWVKLIKLEFVFDHYLFIEKHIFLLTYWINFHLCIILFTYILLSLFNFFLIYQISMLYITYLSTVFDQFVYLYRYCISEPFRISNIRRFAKIVND